MSSLREFKEWLAHEPEKHRQLIEVTDKAVQAGADWSGAVRTADDVVALVRDAVGAEEASKLRHDIRSAWTGFQDPLGGGRPSDELRRRPGSDGSRS